MGKSSVKFGSSSGVLQFYLPETDFAATAIQGFWVLLMTADKRHHRNKQRHECAFYSL